MQLRTASWFKKNAQEVRPESIFTGWNWPLFSHPISMLLKYKLAYFL
jgi:hypothetical protein